MRKPPFILGASFYVGTFTCEEDLPDLIYTTTDGKILLRDWDDPHDVEYPFARQEYGKAWLKDEYLVPKYEGVVYNLNIAGFNNLKTLQIVSPRLDFFQGSIVSNPELEIVQLKIQVPTFATDFRECYNLQRVEMLIPTPPIISSLGIYKSPAKYYIPVQYEEFYRNAEGEAGERWQHAIENNQVEFF